LKEIPRGRPTCAPVRAAATLIDLRALAERTGNRRLTPGCGSA
jgi:hypothetical protein